MFCRRIYPVLLRPLKRGTTMPRTSSRVTAATGLSPITGKTCLSKPRHQLASVVFVCQFLRRISVTVS